MQGIDQSRGAAANREYQCYRFLCSELVRWGNDDQFVFHMNRRKRQEMQQMWDDYYEIRDEADVFVAKWKMKNLLNYIIQFMRGRLPLRQAPAMADDDVATMAYSDDDASTAALEAYFDGLDGFESDDDASTMAYDNASDSTGYATTISISETDDDVENDPASP